MVTIRFDVSTVASGAEHLEQVAWSFEPPDTTTPRGVLVCLPGGSYDKRYWHLEVPDHPGYSFGEHLAAAGFVVIALDHLGVGDSSRPDTVALDLETLAAATDEVVTQVRGRYESDLAVVGVGHSMGACVALATQALHESFDALALLGLAVGPAVDDAAGQASDVPALIEANEALVRQIASASSDVLYLDLPRPPLRSFFYAPDVPEAVIDADGAAATIVPARVAAEVLTEPFVASYAGQISVPLFLGFGGLVDAAADPATEPIRYPRASEVEVCVLDGSAHCHNVAGRRVELWDRIGEWAARR